MKAILRPGETNNCIATSISGKRELTINHSIEYDYIYDNEDNFYLVVDDALYMETSTAFNFVAGE